MKLSNRSAFGYPLKFRSAGDAGLTSYGNDEYTKLLLHGDALPIVDSSKGGGHSITNSSATLDTTIKKYGDAALNFASSAYCYAPASSDWSLGTSWTLDLWIRHSGSSYQKFISTRGDGNGASYELTVNPDTTLRCELLNQTGGYTNGTSPLTANTWYHVAFTYDGTNLKFYINGVLDKSVAITATFSTSNRLQIGRPEVYNEPFTGKIDELRISKGIVRWTENFTPPAKAYK